MTKKELRTEIKNKISCLSEEYKKDSSEKIARAVIPSPEFSRAQSVFIYVSTENEPDTSLIIEEALKSGKCVFVPKCIGKGIMIPVEITRDTVFIKGYMGISEPRDYDREIKITEIDLSVIPCLSANFKGERLGHGAGFYDRFLVKVKTVKMCLCFSELISPEIPTDEYDIIMNAVITENGINKTK